MRVQEAWSRDTSVDPENWTPTNAAWGQCAVTALVVQDFIGGELMAGWVGSVRHYWNEVEGQRLDLTLCQFGPNPEPRRAHERRSRSVVLASSDTQRRYRLLRGRVGLAGDLP